MHYIKHSILSNKLLTHSFKAFLIKCFYTLSPNGFFYNNWHINLITEHLKQLENAKITRLLINVPPRSLKSTIISVCWPAWMLGQDPTKRIIVASYSLGLSVKHSQDTRIILNSKWYKEAFPGTVIENGQNLKAKFKTTKQGFRFATSVGSTLTGEGSDVIIVDDPQTPSQAYSKKERIRTINWYEQTLSTRLNNKKKGVIVVIMQRLHSEDLSGNLLKKRNWKHLSLPAVSEHEETYAYGKFKYIRKASEYLHTDREGPQEIDLARVELGTQAFNAQYQQSPIQDNSSFIKNSWVKRFEIPPQKYNFCYQSWDCAISSLENADYSVCTTWLVCDGKIYLIDVFRARLEFFDLKKEVIRLEKQFKPHGVIIENKASGQSLIQELCHISNIPIIKFNPLKDKFSRLMNIANFFESGQIYLPQYANWLAELEEELFSFPASSHDDQIDSISQFLIWFKKSSNIEINIKKL